MHLRIDGPFVSRTTGVKWKKAGMVPETYRKWQDEFTSQITIDPQFEQLKNDMATTTCKLSIDIRVYGTSRRVDPLDLDNVAKTIFDNITRSLFPKLKGKSTPNTEDRHFWRMTVSKHIDELSPRIEVEINNAN